MKHRCTDAEFECAVLAMLDILQAVNGGAHDDETPGGRIDDKLPGLGDSTDQSRDQLNRFDVRVNCAVNFLRPAAWDAMVSPRFLRGDRWLLQYDQVVTSPPRTIAVADAEIVPGDQIDALELCDALVIAFAKVKRVSPAQQIAARRGVRSAARTRRSFLGNRVGELRRRWRSDARFPLQCAGPGTAPSAG